MVGRKFMAVVFTETRPEDVDLTKTKPCKYFVYIEREIQAKNEEWMTQTAIYCDTLWLQSVGTSNSSLANKKKCVTVPFLLCFTLRVISKYKPPGALIWEGDLTEGILRYEFGRLIFGGAYFRNFTVFEGIWGKSMWNETRARLEPISTRLSTSSPGSFRFRSGHIGK